MDSTFTTFDFFVFLAGAVWLLKKVTEGDRYQDVRVIILTVILSCVALYCYNYIWLEAGNSEYFEPDCTKAQQFCGSEM
jgi:hypothetical protein